MTWMMTVFATPLAFMSSSSISGVASKSGTLAPAAKGKRASCFQTCTCGSRIRISLTRSFDNAAAAAIFSIFRRVTSYIDRFQRFYDVGATSVIAGARAVSRDVEICAEPALEVDAPQHTMAGWEVDLAIPKIIGVGDVLRSQAGA